MFVRAQRSVKAGEELTISYRHEAMLPLDERRNNLRIFYKFTCHCELCQDQEEFKEKEPAKAQVCTCPLTGLLCTTDIVQPLSDTAHVHALHQPQWHATAH